MNISIYGCSPVPRLTQLHGNIVRVPATNRRLRSKFWSIFLNTKGTIVLTSEYGHTDDLQVMKVYINFITDLPGTMPSLLSFNHH